jgi:hypothetical protein
MSGETWQEAPAQIDASSFAHWIVVAELAGGLLCTGPCPRCSDEVSAEVSGHTNIMTAAAQADPGQRFDAPTFMVCNCPEAHPNRPKKRASGCGAFWVARPQRDDAGLFTLTPVDQPQLVQAAKTVYEASQEAGTGIAVAAGKWIPGVSALTGLFGLASIAFSRDAVDKLSTGWRVTAYILVVAATVLAAAATVVIYRAAFGWPERLQLDREEDVLAAARKIQGRVEVTSTRLKQSVGLAGAALAALLAAIGVLWLQPQSQPSLNVEYSLSGNTQAPAVRCGTLLGVASGKLRLRVAETTGSTTLIIPVTEVTRLTPVTKCGG